MSTAHEKVIAVLLYLDTATWVDRIGQTPALVGDVPGIRAMKAGERLMRSLMAGAQ